MLPLLPPFVLPLPLCALPLSLILGIDLNLKFDLLSPLYLAAFANEYESRRCDSFGTNRAKVVVDILSTPMLSLLFPLYLSPVLERMHAQIPLVDMYPGKVLALDFVDPELENIQLDMHRKQPGCKQLRLKWIQLTYIKAGLESLVEERVENSPQPPFAR